MHPQNLDKHTAHVGLVDCLLLSPWTFSRIPILIIFKEVSPVGLSGEQMLGLGGIEAEGVMFLQKKDDIAGG